MSLVNDFRLGADPEFVIVENGHLRRFDSPVSHVSPWGTDHSNWVIEPHPKPELSVRALVQNIRTSLNDFALVSPAGVWRAGAYLASPERTVTLGGHVHIDRPDYEQDQITAMDILAEHMEALDILPAAECDARRRAGLTYGRKSDIRAEHGHYEYRTWASWLFSQRVTKLCLTGTKLCVVDPTLLTKTLGLPKTASVTKLKTFFECFKGKDDDVDWLLDGKIFSKALTIKPDRDLRDVWKVKPQAETPHWKSAMVQSAVAPEIPIAPQRTTPADQRLRFWQTDSGRIVRTRSALIQSRGTLDSVDAAFAGDIHARSVTVNGVLFGFVGMSGQRQWPVEVGRSIVRNEVNRVRYAWFTLASTAADPEITGVLRAAVQRGLAVEAAGLRLVEGRVVLFRSSSPV